MAYACVRRRVFTLVAAAFAGLGARLCFAGATTWASLGVLRSGWCGTTDGCSFVRLLASRQAVGHDANVESRKRALLAAVASLNRGEGGGGAAEDRVLGAVRELEQAAEAAGFHPDLLAVEGRWSLVYSTQRSKPGTGQPGDDEGIVDRLTSQAYRFFFKFAPALAGAQGGGSQTWWGRPRNEQIVDLVVGFVKNTVEIQLPGFSSSPWRARIVVEGEAEPDVESSTSLGIVFTNFGAGVVGDVPTWFPALPQLPLPRPRGSVNTTFVDDELRVSRGGRGGVFVLERLGPVPRGS